MHDDNNEDEHYHILHGNECYIKGNKDMRVLVVIYIIFRKE